jgi:hypothetical protein
MRLDLTAKQCLELRKEFQNIFETRKFNIHLFRGLGFSGEIKTVTKGRYIIFNQVKIQIEETGIYMSQGDELKKYHDFNKLFFDFLKNDFIKICLPEPVRGF